MQEWKTLRQCEDMQNRKVKKKTRKFKSNGNEDMKHQGSATHGEG